MATDTKTRTWLLTRSVVTNVCLHRAPDCEHSEAIALAVAHGEITSQLIDADGLEVLRRQGTYIDRAGCAAEE